MQRCSWMENLWRNKEFFIITTGGNIDSNDNDKDVRDHDHDDIGGGGGGDSE